MCAEFQTSKKYHLRNHSTAVCKINCFFASSDDENIVYFMELQVERMIKHYTKYCQDIDVKLEYTSQEPRHKQQCKPFWGQSPGGGELETSARSVASSEYSFTRSTLTTLTSSSLYILTTQDKACVTCRNKGSFL